MYNTKQKQTLKDFFKNNKDKQYSINEITNAISQNSIGKSTIYRLIDKMTEEGSIRRFRGDGKSVLYQYVGEHHECDSHFHLKCVDCGLLVHLECDYMSSLNKHINEHHKFDIDTSKTVLYGLCLDCKTKGV